MTRKIRLAALFPAAARLPTGAMKQLADTTVSLDFHIQLAREAERGLFDAQFLSERLTVTTTEGGSAPVARLKPLTLFAALSTAPFWITRAALAHMEAGSTIIITASVVAEDRPEDLFDYSQSKAANVIFVKALAKQLGSRGIRVNAVAPGPFWTPLQVVGGQPTDAIREFGADTSLGRPGRPVEIAPLFVLAASAELSFSTGQVFQATGG